ncbi:MAG: 4Fe-4S dicluster domain-containing protein [Dehalococcoidia bacterium]|nr:4Fe-4S dicluster domain-containing protein [Dehalococcoidia bacterium]
MNKVLAIDAHKCTGCLSCVAVCSMQHTGASSLALSRVQVVSDEPRGIHVPMMCQHCEDAPCVAVCPTRAMSPSQTGGGVVLDYSLCIGCRYCAQACPFGAIGLDPQPMKVFKCDLCDGNPACARFCQPQAIEFVPATKVRSAKRNAEARKVVDSLVSA